MEDRQHDLLANRAAELLEHDGALVAVLDERILLRHAAEVDALAHVVHPLEVLAPAHVDDLEHHEALEVAHQPLLEPLDLGLALAVGVKRVVEELGDDRLLVEAAKLVDRDAGAVEGLHRRDQAVEIPVVAQLSGRVLRDHVRDHLG